MPYSTAVRSTRYMGGVEPNSEIRIADALECGDIPTIAPYDHAMQSISPKRAEREDAKKRRAAQARDFESLGDKCYRTKTAIRATMPFYRKSTLRSVIIFTAVVFGLGFLVLVVWSVRDMPDFAHLQSAPTLSKSSEPVVHMATLPPYLVQALLAAEDRKFYHHWGIDVFATARAIVVDIRAWHLVEGGSTITEQLAKNILPPQTSKFMLKLREMVLAVMLEQHFSKNQILMLYLNRVYFGSGAYGIEAAAQRYFDKPASEISLYEAAMLVGLLRAPSRLNPLHDPVLADRRAQAVLQDMVAVGSLTQHQVQRALAKRSELHN